MNKHFLIWAIGLWLSACATHPTISPVPLKPGETYTGVTFSVENVAPIFVYRRGVSERSDIGFRVGLPVYGSGIDFSYLLFHHDNIADVLNLSFSVNPNSNLDMTYYSVRTFPSKPGNALYTGFRLMYIPRGITGGNSLRVGFLGGLSFSKKVGLEIGYFHDFDKGQPIEHIFDWDSYNPERYPATTEYGFPTEYSRLTGISCQLSLSMQIFGKKSAK
ncbi:MAG: hypothetical protein KA076_06275 [Candidatus Marinimicrobia bacterium]|jgi:hypothetical protein|nr:hypothetical protein [Candidatus Neomarinimicrobiota bacterium]OQC43656.1 MAG: hypothetical protein BWX60_00941 [Candidatus Marinimicrobia bacterium ADurb.Bin030]HOG74694.1 hypothetical protein [Candidatus Neomarinimicrobiota bacterium]HOV22936.1 hypothetical protein [Candidatus Neomarinimicrobiota bacterium]HQH55622.1 hypothetical protein [Candidatus Neomarinimicrobiota bacterium]